MAPIAQPYAQDTCGISSGPSPAPGEAERGSGIDFVELKKLHQIASPVALLRRLAPQTRRCLLSYPAPLIVANS